MKYLSIFLFSFLFEACLQTPDKSVYTDKSAYPNKSVYPTYQETRPDTISAAAQAVLKMNENPAREPYKPAPYKSTENNHWRYDVPMPGNTYSNTQAASLKGNDASAWLKLVHGKDINMAVLQLEDIKFFEDQSMVQEIQVQFDTAEPTIYTCAIDPLFGFLVIEPHDEFVKKIKQSHTVTIQAVIQQNVNKTEVRYETRRTSRSYYRGGRRRVRWFDEKVPVSIKRTEIKTAPQTWVFNSSGLVWKY